MKTAKRIILCMLAMVMLASFYCVGSHAYGLGSYTEQDANGNNLFNIYVWNDNNQVTQYTAHAELTKYSASNYNFGICYASIHGKLRVTGRMESRDSDDIERFYEDTGTYHETDVGYFKNGTYCADSATTSNSDFIALHGQGIIYLGYVGTNNVYDGVLVLEEEERPGAKKRIYYDKRYEKIKSFDWVPVQSDGDENIQM